MTRERFLTSFGMTFSNGLLYLGVYELRAHFFAPANSRLGVPRLACPAVLLTLRFVRGPRLDKPAVPPVVEIRAEAIRRRHLRASAANRRAT